MSAQSASSATAYGYLTIVARAELGYFGGLLVIDGRGRPLEFHCTAPVRPTRAQEILFGPTLRPYFWGEQIGGVLVGKCQTPLSVLFVEQDELRCTQESVECPVVILRARECVRDKPSDIGAGTDLNLPNRPSLSDTSSDSTAGPPLVRISDYDLRMASPGFSLADEMAAAIADLSGVVELSEPFERIREAIQEAHRIGWDGQAPHAEAA